MTTNKNRARMIFGEEDEEEADADGEGWLGKELESTESTNISKGQHYITKTRDEPGFEKADEWKSCTLNI